MCVCVDFRDKFLAIRFIMFALRLEIIYHINNFDCVLCECVLFCVDCMDIGDHTV